MQELKLLKIKTALAELRYALKLVSHYHLPPPQPPLPIEFDSTTPLQSPLPFEFDS